MQYYSKTIRGNGNHSTVHVVTPGNGRTIISHHMTDTSDDLNIDYQPAYGQNTSFANNAPQVMNYYHPNGSPQWVTCGYGGQMPQQYPMLPPPNIGGNAPQGYPSGITTASPAEKKKVNCPGLGTVLDVLDVCQETNTGTGVLNGVCNALGEVAEVLAEIGPEILSSLPLPL